MFYFLFKFIFCLIIVFLVYYLFDKKEITILEILILLIIVNICLYSLSNNLDLLETILLTSITIIIYYFYIFLYQKSLVKKVNEDLVLINRGLINFNNLIKGKMTYDNLIYSLRKRGINNPNLVDYCIKSKQDLIIFKKNSIKNYPISIIIDGNILKDNLFSINKSMDWLKKQIDESNLVLKDINYAYFKNKNIYFVTN